MDYDNHYKHARRVGALAAALLIGSAITSVAIIVAAIWGIIDVISYLVG